MGFKSEVVFKPHQKSAISRMKNGCVLWGGVGTGKTYTALGYYIEKEAPRDIFVITTARKRDEGDWIDEARDLGIGTRKDGTYFGVITVDSWQNIGKYTDVKNAFFIFDEQRLVGSGKWSKAFLKIAKQNRWIVLSATPGDTWLDYATIFIANGFYRTRTEFKREHVVYNRYAKFPKVERYIGEGKLIKHRKDILVEMKYERHTKRHVEVVDCNYDWVLMGRVMKDRWHIYEDRPLRDVAEMLLVARKLVNSDESRVNYIRERLKCKDKLIVFYNFDYELEILRGLESEVPIAEWNGHKHQPLPKTDRWLYLVQYTAGAEAWNCVETDEIIFYSMTYSYKQFEQSQGRIDRINTPFTDLYYKVLGSNSSVDKMIWKALSNKKDFNEREFRNKFGDI